MGPYWCGKDIFMDMLSISDYFILGNFYQASLVGERSTDSWVTYPSPNWDNLWPLGKKKVKLWLQDFCLPENLILPNFQRKQDNRIIQIREEKGKKGWEDLPSRKGKFMSDMRIGIVQVREESWDIKRRTWRLASFHHLQGPSNVPHPSPAR
jgi:hypothetical protein